MRRQIVVGVRCGVPTMLETAYFAGDFGGRFFAG
jgi:hypothetical protein